MSSYRLQDKMGVSLRVHPLATNYAPLVTAVTLRTGHHNNVGL